MVVYILQYKFRLQIKRKCNCISDGITRLKTLKPYRFNFISNPSQTVDGFLT